MPETKEVKALKEKVKALERENKGLKVEAEEKVKEPETIKFKKGDKVADVKILDVDGKMEVFGEKQIAFILLRKETRKEFNEELGKNEHIPTGKIITTGVERQMTYADFKDFVQRRMNAGQMV